MAMLCYRPVTVDDIPDLFAVRLSTVENAVTLEELRDDYGVTAESLAAGLSTTLRGWLCAEGATAVGFALGDRSTAEVQVVAVRPAYEGQGIGRKLLGQVCDWLFACGHSEIWLRANPDPALRASHVYRKLGWRRTGRMLGTDEVLTLRAPDSPR